MRVGADVDAAQPREPFETAHRNRGLDHPSARPQGFRGLQVRAASLRDRQYDRVAGLHQALQALLGDLARVDEMAGKTRRLHERWLVLDAPAGAAGDDQALVGRQEADAAPEQVVEADDIRRMGAGAIQRHPGALRDAVGFGDSLDRALALRHPVRRGITSQRA